MGAEQEPTVAADRLVVGTAQLVRRYGIGHAGTVLDRATAIELVRAAAAAGVGAFDTAPVYGEAEAVVGEAGVATPVHTKVTIGDDPVASVARSRAALRRARLDLVLFHDASVLGPEHRAVVDRLLGLVGTEVDAIGVSVYTPEEFELALGTPWVTAIQAPVSIADQRLVRTGLLADAARRGTRVLARSVYLQGALVGTAGQLPAPLADLDGLLAALDDLAHRAGRSRQDLLVAYVRDLPGVEALVLGAESASQLHDNLALVATAPLDPAVRAAIAALPRPGDAVVDPRRWPTP